MEAPRPARPVMRTQRRIRRSGVENIEVEMGKIWYKRR